jgi:EAL domain-containing protein (putative c-di-GMP-specific phosphodiesterase class I)
MRLLSVSPSRLVPPVAAALAAVAAILLLPDAVAAWALAVALPVALLVRRRMGAERPAVAAVAPAALPVAHDPASRRRAPVDDLRLAIERRELVMHFQPKVSLATGRVEALEALVRWQHPRLGLLQPADFLDAAERSGLMAPLTSLALDVALMECRAWRSAGLEVGVAVNLPASALDDERLVLEVAHALERFDVPGRLLRFELAAGALPAAHTAAAGVLRRLRELGVGIAVDAPARIGALPVDELKLGRHRTAALAADPGAREAVRTTIARAHAAGVHVVAEGVEDSGVLAQLAELGCDAVQGFLIGRPTPAASVWPMLSGARATA